MKVIKGTDFHIEVDLLVQLSHDAMSAAEDAVMAFAHNSFLENSDSINGIVMIK